MADRGHAGLEWRDPSRHDPCRGLTRRLPSHLSGLRQNAPAKGARFAGRLDVTWVRRRQILISPAAPISPSGFLFPSMRAAASHSGCTVSPLSSVNKRPTVKGTGVLLIDRCSYTLADIDLRWSGRSCMHVRNRQTQERKGNFLTLGL